MINLVFDHTDMVMFMEHEMDVEHICNVMWDAGYAINKWDAFCAWLSETEVWEDPFDYDEEEIVEAILLYTNVVWEPKNDPWLDDVTEEVSEDATPFEEGMDEILRKQFPYINAWVQAQDDYEPKRNAKPEGRAYYDAKGNLIDYDADTNSFNAPSTAR